MALQQYTCVAMQCSPNQVVYYYTSTYSTMKVNSYMGYTPFFELLAEKPLFHTNHYFMPSRDNVTGFCSCSLI